ncbi:MAG: beta-galactosidase BgaS [Fervidobacterium sp.]|uniref:Beta-glucosidase/6-phospho-beta-glucosidase/beta-galactosidase n=1 Tax=Fervidobacterium gondwanense DSM 13020 TaxID=1121883 RepID=A0A1M7S144_FERGO|nr:beta-galactosidase BgaS [Fervidobacterium gondwanense]UXF00192.1 beta-galactosidase [Fervidobacterium riparium]SHN52012.1 Beta-glucosidase/6-phospho-beta-glucosidase/beta-galactosidase [Fervidobacterium gondwanense DSM 13020]
MFPKDFMFGASLSGFQFEMGNPNDPKEVDPNTDWFVWVREPENLVNGIVSGDLPEYGAGYWKNYEKVHQLAVDFGMDTLRIGIEWSRVFPTSTREVPTGDGMLEALDKIANKEAVEHYRKIMEDMKSKGLKVFVNLNHFTLPLWIHDPISVHKGIPTDKLGWVSDDTPIEFAKYAEYIAWKFSDIVDYWSSMNEPHVVAQLGYFQILAGFPPSYFRPEWYIKSLVNEAKAHNLAYDAIKKYTSRPVGIIYSFIWYDTVNPQDRDIFENAMWLTNWYYIDMVKDKADYIGINYYTRSLIDRLPASGMKFGDFELNWYPLRGYGYACPEGGMSLSGRPASEFGWEVYPEGLYNLIKAIYERYKKIIIVTENGIADEKDKYRSHYLISHLYAVEKAMNEGANVIGYLHWSIVDNYEWAKGYSKRFGLAYTDLEKKIYVPRPSMYIFREIAKTKSIEQFKDYDPYKLMKF